MNGFRGSGVAAADEEQSKFPSLLRAAVTFLAMAHYRKPRIVFGHLQREQIVISVPACVRPELPTSTRFQSSRFPVRPKDRRFAAAPYNEMSRPDDKLPRRQC